MDFKLKDKYALVTGGSHGIGRAIALSLAGEGCHVAICARNRDRVDEVVKELAATGVKVLGMEADVTKSEDIQKVMKKIVDEWGILHILINNAGGGGSWGSPAPEETGDEVWTEVYEKNALAAARFTMLAIPLMKMKKWGRVITIASTHGKEGGGRPWFNMAKAAEISLMKTLSLNFDLVRSGITFNSVAPGPIMIPDTGWAQKQAADPAGFAEFLDREQPLGRLGTPEEVASLVTFICSESASYLNGDCITADGGVSKSF